MANLMLGRDALAYMSTSQKIAYARRLMLDSGSDAMCVSKTLEAFASWPRETQIEFCLSLDACVNESEATPLVASIESTSQSQHESANGKASQSASPNDAMSLLFNPVALANAIAPHLPSLGLDVEAVNAIVDPTFSRISEKLEDDRSDILAIAGDVVDINKRVSDLEEARARIIEIKPSDNETPSFSGLAHRQFSILLNLVNANIPVWIYGGAGNGKTKAIADVAAALQLDYCNVVLPELCDPSELFGYRSVTTGDYIASLFRQRFEFGGIFHLSEACNTSVSLLTSLNNAIECSSYSFPDGTVKRHPQFRVIFDDNTNGTGSADGYKRNTLDLSTRNRFAMFEWEHDLTLEKALQSSLASALKVDSGKLTQWQHTLLILRAAVKQMDMQMLVTMRDAMRGVQLLAMGFDLASTLNYATLGALSSDDRELVKNAMKGQNNA